jgi:hypothetical protein
MKTIEIIVSPTGELRVETRGYHGSECLEATRQLESTLGAKTSEQLTGEFYRQSERTQQRLQGGA